MKKLILIVVLVLALTTSAFAGVISDYVFDLTGYSGNSTLNSFLYSYSSPGSLFNWISTNFTRIDHVPYYTPYEQFVYKNGDCNDISTFFLYYLSRHTNKQWAKQVYIYLSNGKAHMLGIRQGDNTCWDGGFDGGYSGQYWYSSNKILQGSFGSIAACITDYDNSVSASVLWYNVYDYDLNLVSSSKSPAGVVNVAPTE